MEAARQTLGWSMFRAWVGYFAVGGNGLPLDVERWLSGQTDLPASEHNLLAQAMNDEFVGRGLNHHVRYTDP